MTGTTPEYIRTTTSATFAPVRNAGRAVLFESMSRKIAVVEDEAELASLIEYNLVRGGFDVKVLNGGGQTLRELEIWQPDLIVLDVMLPGQDGFDLCRQIRQTGKIARTPVVFLTARSDEVDHVRPLKSGGTTT